MKTSATESPDFAYPHTSAPPISGEIVMNRTQTKKSTLGTRSLLLRLGSATAVLCSSINFLPQLSAQAQSMDRTGVNAIAINLPTAKAQLFVNSMSGKDDVMAGRDESAPFKTIAFALKQARSGMVIQVAPGMYTQETGEVFPLVVPKGVTLQGNEFIQGSNVMITGGDFASSASWGSQNVAILAKTDSQIVGISVTNPNSRGTGIWIESVNVTVRGCTFSKSAREGVFMAGQASATVEANLFVDNSANGIALTGMSTGMVRNNTFQKTGFGIAVSEKAAPQLVNNRIQNNVDGIVVSHSATPQLRGNIIEDNKRDGLVAISNAKPDLGNSTDPGRNIFRGNGRFAVYNATLKNILAIEGNDVTGKMQLMANGPTGVDQNTPPTPELEAYQSKLPIVAPDAVASPGTIPSRQVSTPIKATSTVPVKPATKAVAVKSKPDLSKAQTVKYKGKTYVLLDSVTQK
jgi:parallel beta-helix repeat protein